VLVSVKGRNSRRKSTMTMDRRNFLRTMAAAGAAVALPSFVSPAAGTMPPGTFDFVFFTDTHIQPELDAAHGCDMCFRKIAALNPEFAIMGGDHVFDAFEVNRVRAGMVYDLYKRTEQQLGMPLHHAIGNHDVFGVLARSGVAPSDPAYGKKMYQDRIGQTYYSFDYKGYHFVVLDSIQPTADRLWEARVDEDQLRWLRHAGYRRVSLSASHRVCHLRLHPDCWRGSQVQHHDGRQCSRGARSFRECKRTRGAAGAYSRERSGELQEHAVHHQRSGLRELVAWAAVGHARRIYGRQPAPGSHYLALRNLRIPQRRSSPETIVIEIQDPPDITTKAVPQHLEAYVYEQPLSAIPDTRAVAPRAVFHVVCVAPLI
jgi:hypothetical protein